MAKGRIHFDAPRRRWPWGVAGLSALIAWVTMLAFVNSAEKPTASSRAPWVDARQPHVEPAARAVPAASGSIPARAQPSFVADAAPSCDDPLVAERAAASNASADTESPASRHAAERRTAMARYALQQHVAALSGRGDDLSMAVVLRLQMINDPSALQSLARLAGTTTDAAVYAMAFNACGKGGAPEPPGNCQTVNAERWAQLDPSNLVPWLHVTDAALRRRDDAAADAAMRHAAQARQVNVGRWTATGALAAAVPPGADPRLLDGTVQLMSDLIGAEAAASDRPLLDARAYCVTPGKPPLKTTDESRLALCQRAAEVLTTRSMDLVDRVYGMAWATSLGWPSERLANIRDEYRALSAYVVEGSPAFGREIRCADQRVTLDWLHERAERGEIGLAKARMATAGLGLGDLIERQRRAPMAAGASAAAR